MIMKNYLEPFEKFWLKQVNNLKNIEHCHMHYIIHFGDAGCLFWLAEAILISLFGWSS